MDEATVVERIRDVVRVNRVYAEPVTVDGVTLIAAARVGGGVGGGTGRDPKSQGEGAGGGLGWGGRPAGAFVLQNGQVRWQPAVDVNRLIGAVAAVVVTGLLTALSCAKARARTDS